MINHKILFLQSRTKSFLCQEYIGGEVTFINDLDLNYVSVTHILKMMRTKLKYNNDKELWCKLGSESFVEGISVLESDADV